MAITTDNIINALRQATHANRADACRRGNLIECNPPGDVIMTGDLHGNRRNFEKLLNFADLENNPHRHLILHEMLHCAESDIPNQCHSYQLIAHAAEMKARFPDQIHIILGNHAMAQVSRDEVLKNGQPMVRALNAGICAAFAEQAGDVIHALDDFILSMPLAVRTANRVWMSHSLPATRNIPKFNNDIFQAALDLEDMKNNLSLHALTWDRAHCPEGLAELRRLWDVDLFIIGHKPQDQGCAREHNELIILASDHAHGCFLPFDLDQTYTPDELYGQIRSLAALT